MAAEKSNAIVLRVIDFSETSCVVTLMTRDFGKITAMAKGARRPKSPFESALDVLAICRIVFLHKTAGSMDLLTEAKLEKRFRCTSGQLNRLYAAYYVAELLTALTDDADPHVDLFDLAERTIRRLDDGDQPVSELLLQLEMGTLSILGHQPMLTHCASCGREKPDSTGRVSFGLIAGGILCQACRSGKTSVVSLSHETWRTLVRQSKAAEQDLRVDVPETCRGEIRSVMNQYIAHLIGHRPRLQSYLTSH